MIFLLVFLTVVRKIMGDESSLNELNNLIDFDANLLHDDLINIKNELIETAKLNGVQSFVVPGSGLIDSEKALELSSEYNNKGHEGLIAATCGVHPYHVNDVKCNEESKLKLKALATNDLCHAVGEAGLDYSDGFPIDKEQHDWFKYQISLALELNKPLFLHERAAHNDFISILDSYGFKKNKNDNTNNPVNAIVHCFTGNIEELQTYVDRDYYIGLTGHVIHRLEQEELKSWMNKIPMDRLLFETDAPYMGFKGCRKTETKKKGSRYPNVPASLSQVVSHIAAVADIPSTTLAAAALKNAARLFPRAKFI